MRRGVGHLFLSVRTTSEAPCASPLLPTALLSKKLYHFCARNGGVLQHLPNTRGSLGGHIYRTSEKALALSSVACVAPASATSGMECDSPSPSEALQLNFIPKRDADVEFTVVIVPDIQDGCNADDAQSDRILFANSLKKCASFAHVKDIHHRILMSGQDPFLATLLVSTYAKHGTWKDFRAIFEDTPIRTVITWTAIINSLGRARQGKEALLFYKRMQEEGVSPNNVTFISLLGACTGQDFLTEGRKLHACVDKDQLSDVILGTALVTMYGRCGSVEDARAIFDRLLNGNLISWNAMITAYVDHKHGKEALLLFQEMNLVGVEPDDCTYINALKACVLLEDISKGRAIHLSVVECGLMSHVVVCHAILNMYGKCGACDEAQSIFEQMKEHDMVAWNGIITAFTQQSLGVEALQHFRNMQQQGVKSDQVTYVNVVSACATLSALEEGKYVHACLLSCELASDVQIGNALIHMYGQCGSLGSACTAFDRVRPQNVVSWTAIIAAFSQQGQAKAALELFKEMQGSGVKPDEVTYVTILSACSHAGLLEEGRSYFVSMEGYGLMPNVEHYVCMIDLFGRAGRLSEAAEYIRKVPIWHDGRPWSALLGSCTIHSDPYRGKNAAEEMTHFCPQDTSSYVLLANLYASDAKSP